MMRRMILAVALATLSVPAFACPSPLTGKDAAGATQNFGVTLDGSANCYGNVGIVDGTNAANKATVFGAGADGTSNSTGGLAIYGFGMVFNGTTWDRLRGDATNGAFVNIKSSVALTANQGTGWGFAAGSTTSGQAGSLTMGAVTTGAPSYTTGQTNYISLDPSGNTRVLSSINQGTFGTTNGVVNAANTYQAVAASQTATVLQTSTGATGDYLSHCIIYPTSTSPGVVTVFDSTNTAANSAVLFAGGASSTSNLTPITVPVGAKSVNGAWKVTTGASVSVVCVGHFS